MIHLRLYQTNVKSREMIENAKNAFEKSWLLHWNIYFFRPNSSTSTPRLTTIPNLRPKFPCENFGSNYCINVIKILFRNSFPSFVQETPFFLFFNRKTNSPYPPRPPWRVWPTLHRISYWRLTTGYSEGSLFVDRLCGLVVRVSGYRYRGPGFDPRRYQIF